MALGRNTFLSCLTILTLIHQYVALEAWPFPSKLGHVLLNAPAELLFVLGVLLVTTSQLLGDARSLPAEPNSVWRTVGVMLVTSALCAVAYLFGDSEIFQNLSAQLQTSRLAMWLGWTLVMFAALLSAIARPKEAAGTQYRPAWKWPEVVACSLLTVNVLLLVLPEMPQASGHVASAVGGQSQLSRPFNLQFKLFYADVMAFSGNPLFDVPSTLFSPLHDEYFILLLTTIYLAALSISLFCGAVSPILGYYGAFAASFGIVSLKHVLWIVFSTNNTITLFLGISGSLFLLSRIVLSRHAIPSARKVVIYGVGIGAVATIALYTYAASRVPTFVTLLMCLGCLLYSCREFPNRRTIFVGVAMASLLVPCLFLGMVYEFDLPSFWGDLQKSVVPATPNIYDSKPDFVPANELGLSPDLPSYIGVANVVVPTSGDFAEARRIFWKRSPSEIVMVTILHVKRVFELYRRFPGGLLSWLFVGASIGAIVTRCGASRRGMLLFCSIGALSVLYLTPFIAVVASTEWRRGAAVLLPFGALAGSGLYFTFQALYPRVGGPLLLAAVFLSAVSTLARPSISEIKQTSVFDIRIQHECTYNPAKAIVTEFRNAEFAPARVALIGQHNDTCMMALRSILRSKIGRERVIDVSPSQLTSLASLDSILQPNDVLAIDCGFSRPRAVEGLCSQLGGVSKARLVETSAGGLNKLWFVRR